MADSSLSSVLGEFTATLQKGRLIAIPAVLCERLGLTRRRDNHLLRFSFRKSGQGRWNNDYARLTYDNEFALRDGREPLSPGDAVDVKIRQVLVTTPAPLPAERNGAELLLDFAAHATGDDGLESADDIDEFLNREIREGAVQGRASARKVRREPRSAAVTDE
jgi:hypothetical protein